MRPGPLRAQIHIMVAVFDTNPASCACIWMAVIAIGLRRRPAA